MLHFRYFSGFWTLKVPGLLGSLIRRKILSYTLSEGVIQSWFLSQLVSSPFKSDANNHVSLSGIIHPGYEEGMIVMSLHI